jgi:hypothetical protein
MRGFHRKRPHYFKEAGELSWLVGWRVRSLVRLRHLESSHGGQTQHDDPRCEQQRAAYRRDIDRGMAQEQADLRVSLRVCGGDRHVYQEADAKWQYAQSHQGNSEDNRVRFSQLHNPSPQVLRARSLDAGLLRLGLLPGAERGLVKPLS